MWRDHQEPVVSQSAPAGGSVNLPPTLQPWRPRVFEQKINGWTGFLYDFGSFPHSKRGRNKVGAPRTGKKIPSRLVSRHQAESASQQKTAANQRGLCHAVKPGTPPTV